MSPLQQAEDSRIKACLYLALDIQQAIEDKDEERAVDSASALLAVDFDRMSALAGADEREVRRFVHQAITEMLVHLVYADEGQGNFWQTLVLPTPEGFMAMPLWTANIKWTRMFGSLVPEVPTLTGADLAGCTFKQQAKRLGRFCSTHDATTPLDFTDLATHLHPRLLPFLMSWTIGTYLQSPDALAGPAIVTNQRNVLNQLVAFRRENPGTMPASLMEPNTPFRLSYMQDMPTRDAAEVINGDLIGQLTGNLMGLTQGLFSDGIQDSLAELKNHDAAVFCPNWRESHVAYRCMANLTESMRQIGNPAILAHGPDSDLIGKRADRWFSNTMEVVLPGHQPLGLEYGQLANAIRSAELDFLFYPEVTPSNCTALFATQRLARVQATGYGFPLTTGSPNMDYFIGGTEVELDGGEYSEQLILLPGLGVSTTAPPVCATKRTRPYDDENVRLVSLASELKLTPALLDCWESVLEDQPKALLDLFPGYTLPQADSQSASLAQYLHKARVDLHPRTARETILSTLVDADIYLDSFPFGGFNSLVEVLVAGCPVVTLEGKSARHRFGAALLRRLGLPEFLIARTPAEYVAAARRLIQDPQLRVDIRAQIGTRERVLAALTDPDLPYHFAAAMAWMRETGPNMGRRAPILISAGEKPRLFCA